MANGTDALLIALQAMGIGAGMKVALPNLTFWATYEAVAQLGAEPVLIDINPMDQHLDYGELCSTHQKVKLDAIIFVHLFGYTSSDLQKIRDFASTEGIPLLEDAAQAFGVQHQGRSVFADAELSTISFYPAKVFGGISDGGAILGRNPELIEKCRKLANHGRDEHYSYGFVGWNSRMSSWQAVYLNALLKQIDKQLESRRQALKLYEERLRGCGKHLQLHLPDADTIGNGYLCVITLRGLSAEQTAAELRKRGVGVARTYPETMCQQPPAAAAYRASDLVHSRAFCRSVINLPLFAQISDSEVMYSVDQLLEILEEKF